MTVTPQMAKALRASYLDPNFPRVSIKKALTTITWEQANQKIEDYNTIAALVFHTNYYIARVLEILKGGALNISDTFSFNATIISSSKDWELLKEKSFNDAQEFASTVERMNDTQLLKFSKAEKYGTWYRNLNGIVEHGYYHLGQIWLIKKQLL